MKNDMRFSIKVKPGEFEKRRQVTGPIWLEIDSKYFPDEGWTDFPVIILGWWLVNLKSLITAQATNSECLFMDGPYKFEVIARTKEILNVAFIRDDLDGKKRLLEAEVDAKVLISELLSVADAVIDFCIQKKWYSDDLVTLVNEAKEFKELTRAF
ncbi:MAG: hypothetical protein J2P31_14275 [Blastocatellia bacterium]|nr:hypothetical protein [Blastocatellia bacterium]